MRVTQRQIAEKAGVSQVAVSHVLHQPHRARISEEMQREIRRIAQEMGYQPRNHTTHTIALVVDPQSLWHDVTANILMLADGLLRERGFRMAVSTLDSSNIDSASELFHPKAVDGVIFTAWYSDQASHFSSLKVPWLLLADVQNLEGIVDQVAPDTAATSRSLTEYLLRRGHKRICLLVGRPVVGYQERLQQGVLQAIRAAGLPASNLTIVHDQQGEAMDEDGAMIAALKKKHPPTAVVTGAPGGAMVVLNCLYRQGIRVPDEMSVVSLIDSPRLTALRPRITSTTAVGAKAVEQAVDRLIEKIKQPHTPPQRITVPGEIIERDSVDAPEQIKS